MFNKIIPMEMLAQMPLPFVHRLRDIRIKQLEEANKEQEKQMQAFRNSPPQQANRGGVPSFAGVTYEDLIDELT